MLFVSQRGHNDYHKQESIIDTALATAATIEVHQFEKAP